ncbi:multidrug effflux MFS transporter [Pseudoalteromonas denitrificans]|uniref:Bcr/CflA family efflux transporter n=1 Tax=Pseudoalteromonas denitrificans DSM 6059 TaxID=1123010 RepID=A0A1I1J174_9GAMM|nr:multidrug effflux MFS transporter [Pseudoalteromonas denitrificans]SFC42264.1 MFS transporter, DHA1 family, bicyclomycin/chloramphenicol resistance protein [Pseudoalteromonas denitrificans DSM 6059]
MTNKALLALLMLMVIYSPLAVDIFLPAIPIMAHDFSVPLSRMQWSITLFLLTMGIGQLLSGPLADRYGRRPIAIWGIIIYCISSALSAFSTSFEFFIVCRMIQGFGTCAIIVTAFACVRDKYDPLQSGVVFSYLNSAIYCIPALAPILGHALTELFGWRSTFEVMTAYGVCAGFIIAFFLSETRPNNTQQDVSLISMSRFFSIVKHPIFLFNSILVMLTMAIIIAYVSSSPAWLIINLEQSQQEFVFWFSLNATISIAACFFTPKVLMKFGVRKTIELGMIILFLSGLLMFALREWHHPIGFMLPIMFSSIGGSLLMGTCAGQALLPFGKNAGTASALLGFIQMTGSAILVSLLQLLPLNEPEQLALLILSILPMYILWKRPKVKSTLYPTHSAQFLT